MVGIVQTGELWAPNVLYLNDKSELSNAMEFFKRELDGQPLGLAESVDFPRLMIHTQFGRCNVEHFAVSFCEGPDLLEQWRAYGGSGSGYALGFRSSALTPRVFDVPSAWMLRKVLYTESAKRKLVQDRLAIVQEILAPFVAELTPANDNDLWAILSLFAQLSLTFHSILPLMKHEAFEGEAEWRLLRSVKFAGKSKDIRVRAVGTELRPYIVNQWLHPNGRPENHYEGLAKIHCGPASEPDLKKKACSILLANHGFSSTEVTSSSVPLRT
jgi:hypothetical protein